MLYHFIILLNSISSFNILYEVSPQKHHNIIYSARDGSNNCLGNWNISENLKACSACIAKLCKQLVAPCSHASVFAKIDIISWTYGFYYKPEIKQASKSSAIEQGQLLTPWKSFIFLTNYKLVGAGNQFDFQDYYLEN